MGVGSSSNTVLHWLIHAGGDCSRMPFRVSLTAWVTVVLPALHLQKEASVILFTRYTRILKTEKHSCLCSRGMQVQTSEYVTWASCHEISSGKWFWVSLQKLLLPFLLSGPSSPSFSQLLVFTPLNVLGPWQFIYLWQFSYIVIYNNFLGHNLCECCHAGHPIPSF